MSEKKSIPCKWCGEQTTSLGTKECDRCWELRTRIEKNKVIAAKIFVELQAVKFPKIKNCWDAFQNIYKECPLQFQSQNCTNRTPPKVVIDEVSKFVTKKESRAIKEERAVDALVALGWRRESAEELLFGGDQ